MSAPNPIPPKLEDQKPALPLAVRFLPAILLLAFGLSLLWRTALDPKQSVYWVEASPSQQNIERLRKWSESGLKVVLVTESVVEDSFPIRKVEHVPKHFILIDGLYVTHK